MEFKSKFFNELSACEIYEILKSRAQIFVVEQSIKYVDMDDIDYESLHIFCLEGGRVAAYFRAYPKRDEENTVHIGRVLTLEHGKGHGKMLLKNGIEAIKEKMSPEKLYIEAQSHAIGFYERMGFTVCSDEFLEEGIPHVKMELILKEEEK